MEYWQDTPAQLLSEILGGIFDGLQKDIAPTETSATLLILGGNGVRWQLSLQRLPASEEEQSNTNMAGEQR